MSGSSRTPPAILSVDKQNRETRPYEKKRPLSLWVGTGVGGTIAGFVLGTFAPALAETFGITSEGVSAIAAVAVAGFTWALVRANASSARNAEDTLRHLRESSRQELRAYLGVGIVQPNDYRLGVPRDPLGRIESAIRIWNHGRTPARNVRFWGRYEVGPKSGEHIRDFSPEARREGWTAATLCDPGVGTDINALYFPIRGDPANDADIAAAITGSGETVLHVYGTVRYTDVFGAGHETDFCAIYCRGIASGVYPWIDCGREGHSRAT